VGFHASNIQSQELKAGTGIFPPELAGHVLTLFDARSTPYILLEFGSAVFAVFAFF
jgi:hypothetical protein